jgi:hypothetical protein
MLALSVDVPRHILARLRTQQVAAPGSICEPRKSTMSGRGRSAFAAGSGYPSRPLRSLPVAKTWPERFEIEGYGVSRCVWVDQPTGERWQLALELLRAGDAVVVGDGCVRLVGSGLLVMIAANAWRDPECVSSESALPDLDRAEAVLVTLQEASPEFRVASGRRQREFEVVTDHETGAVRRRGELATWADGCAISRIT